MTVTVTITCEVDPDLYRGMDNADVLERLQEYSLIELANDGEVEWDIN